MKENSERVLPAGFVDYLRRYEQLRPLEESLLTEPAVSVRLNDRKPSALFAPGDGVEIVPWCPEGRYLPERPQFTLDPAFHQGLYYVQEASSMAISAVVRHLTADGVPVRYLDVCAAPGGKTTAAIGALPEGSAVVANEFDFRRAEILAENIVKWGYPDVVVARGDTSRLRRVASAFDIVAVDAPCSGEGMMRKEAVAIEQWSPALVRDCAALQREILANAWVALRPGGYLIYSTCTFNCSEDEENLQWLVEEYGAEPVAIPALDASDGVIGGIDTLYPCYRFLPGRVRSEGLFIAVVRKPQSGEIFTCRPGKFATRPTGAEKWLAGDWRFTDDGTTVSALPARNAAFLTAVAEKIGGTLLCGVDVAVRKGRDIIPEHAYAMLAPRYRNADAFPTADVDKAMALSYLRRDSIELADALRGFVMPTFGGFPLGFMKNLGNRANNLYPKNFRIRMQG